MQKSHIYILIIWAVGFFLAFQWQINKMDRKLTCIVMRQDLIIALVAAPLATKEVDLKPSADAADAACDKSYIFLGIPK